MSKNPGLSPFRKVKRSRADSTPRIYSAILALLLGVVTIIVFWPVKNELFLVYDDPQYVLSNPHVQNGLTLRDVAWAFEATYAANWHPLTWISHMLDIEIFGHAAAAPHLINLFFHVSNTLLLFLILRAWTGAIWRSGLTAALFAIHPLHVESVAWIAERKDVLSTFFLFVTFWFYGRFAQKPHAGKLQPRINYALALLSFIFALMSKPMVVTLPFLLLLVDYWPFQRLRADSVREFFSDLKRLALEKTPFFFSSAVLCAVTIAVQQKGGAIQSSYSPGVRIENALMAYERYLAKTVWPVDLMLPYPPFPPLTTVAVAGAAMLLTALVVGAFWSARKFPFIITGFFWFLGMLVPVVGLVPVGMVSIADRYTYVPIVGLFIILAWCIGAIGRHRLHLKILMTSVAIVALIACAVMTRSQLSYWQNSETLFTHALRINQENAPAWYQLGSYFLQEGRSDDAIRCFSEVVRLAPNYGNPYDDLGLALAAAGRLPDAIASYHQALASHPNDPKTLENLGMALAMQGHFDEAVYCYQQAIRVDPTDPVTFDNLGVALASEGKTGEAIQQFQMALQLDPNYAEGYHNLGLALAQSGRLDEAIKNYRKAIQINPNAGATYFNLANALAEQGNSAEAISCYDTSLRLDSNNPRAQFNLASVLVSVGRTNDARTHLENALQLKPDYREAKELLRSLDK